MFEKPLETAIVPVTPFQQNATVFWCNKTMKGAVIDPGGHLDRIMSAVERAGVTLEKIFITHAHRDHAGMAADFSEQQGIPIEGPHQDDQFWIDKLSDAEEKAGFDQPRPFTPDRWLFDGDTVTVGEQTLDVFHCPGHTPGHVVYYHGPSQLAVVGDVLFRRTVGRTDLPKGNHDLLVKSITEKLWPLGNDVMFLPGHGRLSTFGQEREDNPYVSDMAVATGAPPPDPKEALGPKFN